jgi:glycosyltransferase involved in cell wall biosynthesis
LRSEFTFDLIHAHNAYLDGNAGLELAKKYGVPLVVTEHTGPFTSLLRNMITKRVTLRTLEQASEIIAVSQAQKSNIAPYLSKEAIERLMVIPNGVDGALFYPPLESESTGRSNIFFIGHLVRIKRVELLLQAMPLILNIIPKAKLYIIGLAYEQDYAAELENQVARTKLKKSVFFEGYKPRAELAESIRTQCDVLALCSQAETFGCVAAEALFCGKPVVSTRCGGPEDIVEPPLTGRLVENNNHQALAEALVEVLTHRSDFPPDQIRRVAEIKFDYQTVANSILETYLRVLRKS